MGRTDSQFKAFIRLAPDDMREHRDEPGEARRATKLDRIIENL